MNKDQLAAKMNCTQYPVRISKDVESEISKHNLVVVFGASDDLMEFRGAICDEVAVYNGGHAFINGKELLQPDDIETFDDAVAVLNHFKNAKVISALWCKEGDYSWTYKTDIPHATFEVLYDDENYCRGIVFSLDELESKEDELNRLKEEAYSALDDAVSKLHKYACSCELGKEREKAFAVYQAARLAPGAE